MSAVVADSIDIPVRSGTIRGAGPCDTNVSTAVPLMTSWPATNVGCDETVQRMMIPARTSSLYSGVSTPTTKPFSVSAANAVAASRPFRSGSGTGGGPVDTTNVKTFPVSSFLPVSGSVRMTAPTGNSSLASSTMTMSHLNSVTKLVASP